MTASLHRRVVWSGLAAALFGLQSAFACAQEPKAPPEGAPTTSQDVPPPPPPARPSTAPVAAPPAEPLPPESQRAIDEVAAALQERLSVDPRLQTIRITGYHVVREGDVRRLEIDAVAPDDASAELVEALSRDLVAANAYWAKADPPLSEVHVTTRLRGAGRPDLSTRYFQIAHRAFRHCDPGRARTAFQLALDEDAANPARREVLNYWILLCDLQLGRTDLVRERLAWLLEQNPQGSSSLTISIALESVQGPLRGALLQLEEEVLLNRLAATPQSHAAPYEEPGVR